jgi:DNA transformation protein
MREKGDKLTPQSVIADTELVEKLQAIEGVSTKKMFGGHGIFHNSKMFGLIDSKGISFLKADETHKPDYLAKGSHQHSRMPYYSIPDDVLLNDDELVKWVEKSMALSK